jgi:DNA-binding winged helix-turn-helix (wHTH) protein
MQNLAQFTISWRPPQVREGNRPIKLSPRQFKVLSLLVRARGKIVLKQVFFEKVWNGSFVEDGNLSQTIFLLRRALGKLPGGRDLIETVPGKAYRLASGVLPSRHQGGIRRNPLGAPEGSDRRLLED